MNRPLLFAGLSLLGLSLPSPAQPPAPTLTPLVRTIDLTVGEARDVELAGGKKVAVKLLELRETRDDFRNAVCRAEVIVDVAGQKVSLVSANYRLPVTVAGVQIDCPVTKGYRQKASRAVTGEDAWGLDKDARLRLWPAGSPLLKPDTFRYPARQRWFASGTQMANEPVHVDGGENPLVKDIYYHYGLDIGGAEGMVDVIAATDGLVVSAGKEILSGYKGTPAQPRYDVVYVLDERGWYYRYSHLHTIVAKVKPGARVKMGQLIGLLGKEGGSGGWSHLHFDIFGRQPSGKWGVVEGYAFLWEAYLREYKPKLLAVARPHQLAALGEKVVLDGGRSWSATGKIASYEWTFTDGKTAVGQTAQRTYAKPGVYSEVLKITDGDGRVDYDFAVVNVLDKERLSVLPPSIHAAYAPTFGIKSGDPVMFLVRTFRTTDGKETWEFGDGSPKAVVQSDGNVVKLAKDGYARTVHTFKKPGHYLVRVERTDRHGYTAVAHLHVRVGGSAADRPTAASVQGDGAAPDWIKATDKAAWQPRDSSGEVVFKDQLWILGGWFDSFTAPPRDVWSSRDGKTWNLVTKEAPWKHSDLPMTLVFKDRMWLMGGWFNGRLPGHSASNEVWSSADGVKWEQQKKAGWSPRIAAGAVVFKDRMWILGGTENYYFGDDKSLKNDVWSSADGKEWKLETARAPWSARAYHAAVVHDGKIWVLGGGNYVPKYHALNDVWYSSDGVKWEQATSKAPWAPRVWFSAVVYRNRMWVLGGWSNNPSKNWGDVWYSRDGKQWSQLQSKVIWKERHEHSAYVFKDKIWVAAGHAKPLSSEVWSLEVPRDWFKDK